MKYGDIKNIRNKMSPMPFQIRRSDLAKLDVLEAKFNIYEELSRQMMDKLEVAVDKISEANNRIATILTKHDERIEQTMKNDDNISKRLEIMKIENKEETADIVQRIEKVENKVEEFAKYRWIIIGVFAVISFIISQSNLVIDILTPDSSQTQIEKNK